MTPEIVIAFFAFGMLPSFLLAAEFGRWMGHHRQARSPEGLPSGTGAAEGSAYALVGLVLAFSFSGAESRFEDRRQLITTEVNAIGTAYQRLDLLPQDIRASVRADLRRYVDTRIATYRDVNDAAAVRANLQRAASLQDRIWQQAVAASTAPGAASSLPVLLLPALNDMFDISTTRTLATRNHPPTVIFVLLVALNLVGAALSGYATSVNRRRPWFYLITLATVLSVTQYVIIDLEFPRVGLIRVDDADQALVELRRSMS